MRSIAYKLGIIVLLALAVVAPANAQPPVPHAFYGAVYVNGQPADVGSSVEAKGTGIMTGIDGNPITTIEEGKYGGPGPFDPKLIVQGEVEDGTPIEFYVNGMGAECYDAQAGEWVDSYPFKSGEITELNLRVAAGPTPTPTSTHEPTATLTPKPPTPTATPTSPPGPPTIRPSAATATQTSVSSIEPTSTPKPPVPSPTATPTKPLAPKSVSVPMSTASSSAAPMPTETIYPVCSVAASPTPSLQPSRVKGEAVAHPPLLAAIGLAGIAAVGLWALWGKRLWGGR